MRVLAGALTLSAVVVLGIAAFEAIPTPSYKPAQGIVWRGQTFLTRAQFAHWLRSHGTTYRAWARRHPVQAGLTRPGGQTHSKWSTGRLLRIAAVLGALALGVALVRRRWPESGAFVGRLIGVTAVSCAAVAAAAARRTGRWAAMTAQRSMTRARATAAASGARNGTSESAVDRLEVVALRSAAAAEAVAGTTRRRAAALTAQRSRPARTNTAVSGARNGTGGSAARRLEVLALRGATAAEAGARTTGRWAALVALRGAAAAEAGARTTGRWAALKAQRLIVFATTAEFSARRRRSELGWYVTVALLAAGIGVVVKVSLNGG